MYKSDENMHSESRNVKYTHKRVYIRQFEGQ